MEFWNKAFYYFKKALIYFILTSIFSVIVFRFIPPPATPLMGIRAIDHWWNNEKVKFNKEWKSIDEVSIHIQKALIASEDQDFLNHFGFDFKAMKAAFKYNQVKNHHKIKGGSTITQQVAKNLFLWPGRSYIRKIFEAYFTLLIEIFWSKERILEVYLNIIELGRGIYGIEAASQKYFHHISKKINPSEAALIAAIVPNPLKLSPTHPSRMVKRRQKWILFQMHYIKELNFRE